MNRLTATRDRLSTSLRQFSGIDLEVLRYAAWVSLWGRWFLWLAILAHLAYRPETWFPHKWYFLLGHIPLVICNGLFHYWLLSKRPVTWHWLVGLSALDIALVTTGQIMKGEFGPIFHLGYYPALALVTVILPSLGFTLIWTTMVAGLYTVVSVTQGSGLDMDRLDDKTLIARVATMYAVVIIVGLIVQFERRRRQSSMEREREIERERIEVSRTIHDSVAQTVYMVGLGIDRARKLAGESDEQLSATLDETADLSRSVMWALRRPLDGSQVYEGTSLGAMLQSHAATFTTVTSIPAEVAVHGAETALTTEVRNRLFSIAHNALTNAFRHARAGKVDVELDFGTSAVRMSVSDDGIGLSEAYANRGRGFAGMREDTEAIGGSLTVDSDRQGGGTTVTCTVPLKRRVGHGHTG